MLIYYHDNCRNIKTKNEAAIKAAHTFNRIIILRRIHFLFSNKKKRTFDFHLKINSLLSKSIKSSIHNNKRNNKKTLKQSEIVTYSSHSYRGFWAKFNLRFIHLPRCPGLVISHKNLFSPPRKIQCAQCSGCD